MHMYICIEVYMCTPILYWGMNTLIGSIIDNHVQSSPTVKVACQRRRGSKPKAPGQALGQLLEILLDDDLGGPLDGLCAHTSHGLTRTSTSVGQGRAETSQLSCSSFASLVVVLATEIPGCTPQPHFQQLHPYKHK